MRLLIALVGFLALFSPSVALAAACPAAGCAPGQYCAVDARIPDGSACYATCRSAIGGSGGCTGTNRCVSVTGQEVCVPADSPLATGGEPANPVCGPGRTCPSDRRYECQESQCRIPYGLPCERTTQCMSGSECIPPPAGGASLCTPAAAASSAVAGESGLPEQEFVPIVPELGVDIPGLEFTPARRTGDTVEIPYLAQYINAAYRYLVGISLIAAIVMTVYGGFRYLAGSSLGDVKSGKKIIVDALAGMLIVLGAYMILGTINPATLDLSVLRLDFIVGLSDLELEELEAEFGEPYDPGASSGSTGGSGGGSGEFIIVDESRMVRVNDTCIHTSTPVDPSLVGPLQAASRRFCELRGSHTDWRIAGGGFRPPALSLRLWLKRCVNRINCTVGTGAPLRPGVVARDGGRWSFSDPALRAMVNSLPAPTAGTPYADGTINALYERLLPQVGALSFSGHGRGLAVDLFCGGATTNQMDAFVPCQLILEQAMKESGFCRIPNEWWHFELASNHPDRRCNPNWTIGSVEVRVGDATSPTTFNYASCRTRYSIRRAAAGTEACH